MSKETEKESMFQSFQAVISRVTQATNYVTQKIPFFSKDTRNKDTPNKDKDTKEKASTDSFADSPPSVPPPKNYTVLATSLTDVVSMLQAPPTDSKSLRDTLTKGTAILQDLKGTLLQGDPSIRDQSHASAITDVIQNLEKLSKESVTNVNTSNLTTVMAIATTTLNTVASTMTQVSASGIFNKIIEIIQQLIYPLLILYLASLVSNEMIVYPAPIRFLFFLFVLTLCSVFSPATVVLVFYYLVKAGYSYYRNELEDRDGDTTPIRIYPRIFAIMPITTTPGTSFLGRFFKYPFYYPKTEEDRKELERTDGGGNGKKSIMDEYMEALQESFPYGDTVKGSEPFVERYATVEKNMKRIHAAPVVPAVSAPTVSTDNLPPTIKRAPNSIEVPSRSPPNVIVPKVSSNVLNTSKALPAVIASNTSIASNASNASKALPADPNTSKALPAVIASNASNASKALPAVIASKTLPAVPNASKALPAVLASNALNASNASKALPAVPNASKALPAVISSTSTSADILDVMASNGSKIPAPKVPKAVSTMSAVIASPQWGGAIKTRSPTSGGWLWNGI